jgi:hypothetical protein
MAVQQLSVILDNLPGKLAHVSELLGKEGINIGAIFVSDSSDTSNIRFICDDPDKATRVLEGAGHTVLKRDVLAVETPDHPGGLSAVLKPLSTAGVNVHYLYPYLRRVRGNAILIFRVDNLERATEVLKSEWISILDQEIYSI